jgi:hypothetical protein
MRGLAPLLVALVVLTGCGTASDSPARVGSETGTSSKTHSLKPTKPTKPSKPHISESAVPVPGWAGGVVAAAGSAYVTGWHPDGSGALWRVDAAGRLWLRTPPPGMPGNPGLAARDRVFQLVFASDDIGLAITGTEGDLQHRGHKSLYVTTDGAHTWTQVGLPTREQPTQIATGDGAAYALTSNCPGPKAACDHATLWRIDPTGGSAPQTFDTLPSNTHTSGPITLADYGDDVWVFLNMGAGQATALRSEDGGRSWRRFDPGICLWASPVATSSLVLWTTCGTGMLEHFTRQVDAAPPGTVFPADVAGTSNSALYPLTDTLAYAILEDRHDVRVEITRDGGHTTSVIAPVPRDIARRGFTAAFVSAQVGYLVTRNGGNLYRTDNGARLWHKITPPPA